MKAIEAMSLAECEAELKSIGSVSDSVALARLLDIEWRRRALASSMSNDQKGIAGASASTVSDAPQDGSLTLS